MAGLKLISIARDGHAAFLSDKTGNVYWFGLRDGILRLMNDICPAVASIDLNFVAPEALHTFQIAGDLREFLREQTRFRLTAALMEGQGDEVHETHFLESLETKESDDEQTIRQILDASVGFEHLGGEVLLFPITRKDETELSAILATPSDLLSKLNI